MQNKKGNMSVIAAIIAIVAITAGVVSWQFAKKSETPTQQTMPAPVAQTPAQSSASQPVASTKTADETANWQTYSNAKYGFEIKLPYQDYKVAELPGAGRWTVATISFSVTLERDKKMYQSSFFSINIDNMSRWNESINSSDCKKTPDDINCPQQDLVLGKNSKYIISYSLTQDPTAIDRYAISKFEKEYLTSIRKSFKDLLNKQNPQATIIRQLEDAALASLGMGSDWNGPKRPEVVSMDVSQKAAIGKYWEKDAWNWIAWKKDDGKWNIIASRDGFKCNEFNMIPSQYNDYFENVMYMSGKKNCYN